MLLAGIMLAALLLAGCTSADTARRMRMGVAGEGGVYHAFGEGFAALENDSGNGAVELKNTAGSAANLRLLMGDYLQLAVAQADLVQDAYEQSGIFQDEEMENKFCAVAALYTEACQVIVRADSDIQSVEELQGKTVSIGAEESGSEQNAWQILSAYGLNEKLVETINLNYEDAAAQLKAGRIDAMFITAGAPSAVVTALAEDCGIRLLCVDGGGGKGERDGRCGCKASAGQLQQLQRVHHSGGHLPRTGRGSADGRRKSGAAGQRGAAGKAGGAADKAVVRRARKPEHAAGYPAGYRSRSDRGRGHPVPQGSCRLL